MDRLAPGPRERTEYPEEVQSHSKVRFPIFVQESVGAIREVRHTNRFLETDVSILIQLPLVSDKGRIHALEGTATVSVGGRKPLALSVGTGVRRWDVLAVTDGSKMVVLDEVTRDALLLVGGRYQIVPVVGP